MSMHIFFFGRQTPAIACAAAMACAVACAHGANSGAVASGVDAARSAVADVVSGIADAVDPSAPNMLSREMKEEKFYDQPLAFQTNLLRLVACANAAYPGVGIPEGYRPFTDAEWRACGLDAVAMAPYAGDGYLQYATGLRARLMASKDSDDVVVAWSGCDFDNGSSGFTDASAVTKQYFGYLDGQYAQALRIMNGVLNSTSGRVEVVGHSLGGGLTTYVVAACSDDKGRVTGATFNGLGLSRMLQSRLSAAERRRAENSIVNVKNSADPVFVMPMARHYGRIYDIPQESDAWKAHSIDILIGVMRRVLELAR